jgi:hypothetical protein
MGPSHFRVWPWQYFAISFYVELGFALERERLTVNARGSG